MFFDYGPSNNTTWNATKSRGGRVRKIDRAPSLDEYDGYEEETESFVDFGTIQGADRRKSYFNGYYINKL